MNTFLRQTFVMFKNELTLSMRNVVWVVFGLFQPLVYLLLFRPFLGALVNMPGFPSGNTVSFFVPGVLIMMAIFNTAFVGFPLIDKLRSGVIERWRVTPVSRLALVLGLVLKDAVTLLVQCVLLFIVAVFMGLDIHITGLLVTLLLLALVGVSMASASYTLALTLKDEGGLASATNFFLLPLFLLSGIMLPLSFAPKSIQAIADFNPFAYAATAARALVNGNMSDSAIPTAFVVFAAFAVLMLQLAIRSMRKATA